MSTRRLLLSAGLALVALAAVVSPADAVQPQCKAIDQSQGVAYNSNATADPLGTAITAAAAGDTIKVIGTCHGNFAIDKDLTLRGRKSDRQTDLIDGGGSGVVLDISGLVDVTVSDLMITRGAVGIRIAAATVALTRIGVTGNEVGLRTTEAFTTIESSVFADNDGDGIQGGLFGTITMSDSVVRDNAGSGIAGGRTGLAISDSVIADNLDGGLRDGNHIQVAGSLVEGNAAAGVGGGIAAFGFADVVLDDSIVRNNGASRGGGIFWDTFESLTITDSVVTGNRATESGGGIYVGAEEGSSHPPSFTHVTVSANTAPNGGGIFFSASDRGTGAAMTGATVTGNTAVYGGGIWNDRLLTLTDSVVTGNTATAAGGGVFGTGVVALSGTATVCSNTPDDWPGC